MPIYITLMDQGQKTGVINSPRLSDSSSESEESGHEGPPAELMSSDESIISNAEPESFNESPSCNDDAICTKSATFNESATYNENATFNEGSTYTNNESCNDNDNVSNKRSRTKFESEGHDDHAVVFEPPKKKKTDIGKKLMERMGYFEGAGLGKNNQGRLEPVEAFHQKGRRGFAFENTKLKEATLKWDPSSEITKIEEIITWLTNKVPPPLEVEMNNWMEYGPIKETIDDESLFCDNHILQQVVKSKSIFDGLDKYEMRRARARSNPFETVRGAFFQNRAAVKMANMDKACDFMFTQRNFEPHLHKPIYFADVCAGPGGFSEYVLWRKKWNAKGFGFTLKESNDFELDEFFAGSPETFHPYYGPKEDGNVYDPENQKAFANLIMHQTKGQGVHFMMADGGFSVARKENIQELLSKQLYLCQCLVALMIVREGGHFVVKLFDLFTPFSAGLVYLMFRCFKQISIFKPNTSRPANSERYLICQNKLPNTHDVMAYMQSANEFFQKRSKTEDLVQLVPLNILRGNKDFYTYLTESNESLGKKQVMALLKIAAYSENPYLIEDRQAIIRTQCLRHWELPDRSRCIPLSTIPENRLRFLLGSKLQAVFEKPPMTTTLVDIDRAVCNPPCNWHCFPSTYNKSLGPEYEPTLYFGMGRTKVYRLIKGAWQAVTDIELPPDTLVYAEMVMEHRSQGRKQRKTAALHIIDAWLLGAEDISQKYLPDRQMLIQKFCEALWKPTNSALIRVRPKRLYSLDEDLPQTLILEPKQMKNGSTVMGYHPPEPSYSVSLDDKKNPFYYIPMSLVFLECTNYPWSLHLSRSTRLHYFFNYRTDERVYNDQRPQSAVADFSNTFGKRVFLDWSQNQENIIQLLNAKTKAKCSKPPRN